MVGVVDRPLQLDPHPVEPRAGVVGEHPLQGDQVEHLPVALAGQHQLLRGVGHRLRQVEIEAEVGDLAPGEEDVGVVLAAKGQNELAISVVKNSVAQIAAFLYPVLVLVSLLTVTSLTFALAPVYTGALLGTAILVWQITGDGEATMFEGVALVAMYITLGAFAWLD